MHFIGGIVHFQKAVYGFCLFSGKLRKTFCGAACGRSKHNGVALLFQQVNKGVKSCGLACAGSAGKHEHMIAHSFAQRLFLQWVILNAKFAFKQLYGTVQRRVTFGAKVVQHHAKASCGRGFCLKKFGKIDKPPSVTVIFLKFVLVHKLIKRVRHGVTFA